MSHNEAEASKRNILNFSVTARLMKLNAGLKRERAAPVFISQ
jgi:hypothetical protein